ncbi:hypothetical protein K438DRAFT_1977211 [Mycena galopus ATCC 62051]|nr:hypothetical protein K438DRAFT_1977211 [Mycena galopus ATCC 62051]
MGPSPLYSRAPLATTPPTSNIEHLEQQSFALEPWDDMLDWVPSSQPFEDGVAWYFVDATEPSSPASSSGSLQASTPEDITPRCRARLVRRVVQLPMSSSPLPTPLRDAIPRPRNFNLVRRVSIAPAVQKKQKRALKKVQHIGKRLRSLRAEEARLRRKHRALRAFLAGPCGVNKENVIPSLL